MNRDVADNSPPESRKQFPITDARQVDLSMILRVRVASPEFIGDPSKLNPVNLTVPAGFF